MNRWLAEHLSADTETALAHYQGPGSDSAALETNLVGDFNRLILGPSLFELPCFGEFAENYSRKELARGHPRGNAMIRLNGELLHDAFPQLRAIARDGVAKKKA